MTQDENKPAPKTAREAAKSRNRRHLLDSAANVIFKSGIRGATIAAIQQESGLSRGLINLHFQTKENLLLAVAADLSRHYRAHWERAATSADLPAADRLRRIFQADLSPAVLNARDVAIWFAFRSEVSSNPEYHQFIASRDAGFRRTIIEICQTLIREGVYEGADAILAANSFVALLEGIWTDFHLHTDDFDRDDAERTCLYVAKSFFPKHF
ncbi:TetR/AcrR family transcriptional regulator [Roseovarius dicentrarchi]|uniref:TetR/AcrR family transcriptional regulator n=1 Tax=Roseovarius dicentrarchi TaxID=2250573 RepID=UPI001EF0E228|nr:TetR family transcriptional regulator C-terminal domain-containing protein [Roseovarius dicentrarchi]